MTYEPPGGPPPPPPPPWQPQPMSAPYPASTYGAPGYGYAPATQVQSVKGLAMATSILVALCGLIAIFLAVALFNRVSVDEDVAKGIFNSTDIENADDSVTAAVGFFFVAVLAAGVLWIIWQFRFAKNAAALRGNHGLAPGWAIGGWFVPFGNYVLPQLQLFQAAKASDPDLPAGQPAADGRAPAIILAWWISLDLAWVLFGLGRTVRPSDDEFTSLSDIDRFAQADRLSAFSALVFVLAAVVAVLMVRTLSDRQSRAAASAPSDPQPWHLPPQPWQQPSAQTWQQPPPAAPPPPPQTWAPPPPNQPWQPPPPPAPPPPPPQ